VEVARGQTLFSAAPSDEICTNHYEPYFGEQRCESLSLELESESKGRPVKEAVSTNLQPSGSETPMICIALNEEFPVSIEHDNPK
jgi:hypothetical protein